MDLRYFISASKELHLSINNEPLMVEFQVKQERYLIAGGHSQTPLSAPYSKGLLSSLFSLVQTWDLVIRLLSF